MPVFSYDNTKVLRKVWIDKESKEVDKMSIPVLAVPVLNRYDLLINMLDQINYPIDNILIIDNGGSLELDPKYNAKVLNMPSNFGMSASWNLAIKCYPKAKYWLFASADTVWGEDSLAQIDAESGSDYLMLTSDNYGCYSVGENLIDRVGLFDEYFYPIYFEDNDFHERVTLEFGKDAIKNCDYIKTNPEVGSQTINSNPKLLNRNHETFVKNEEYFNFKKDNGFKISKGWSLSRRRDQEWVL